MTPIHLWFYFSYSAFAKGFSTPGGRGGKSPTSNAKVWIKLFYIKLRYVYYIPILILKKEYSRIFENILEYSSSFEENRVDHYENTKKRNIWYYVGIFLFMGDEMSRCRSFKTTVLNELIIAQLFKAESTNKPTIRGKCLELYLPRIM